MPIENTKNYSDQNGYVYSRNNNNPKLKNLYFRCKNSEGIHLCRARAIATNKNLKHVKLTCAHSHLPGEDVLEKTKFDGALDSIIESNKFMPTRELYFKARENVPTDKVRFVPLRKSYGSFIQRRKQKYKPKNPKTVEEFQLLINSDKFKDRYCMDQRNNTFYRGVWTDKNGNKMIAFVSETGLEFLKTLEKIELLMDGTFKVLPRHIKFCQFYVISFMYEERNYPFAFIFMEKRDTEAYNTLFEKLIAMMTPECALNVIICMSDYEAAVRKMCKKHFPNARISGCFFHYVKAINKCARRFGLSKDVQYQQAIREVCALALLPNDFNGLNFVSIGFDIIVKKTINSAKWTRFKNYWLRQWLPANISVFGLRNRTDNFSETFNRSFNLLNGKPHQNIWVVLKNLKQIEMDKVDELEKHKEGKMFRTRTSKITKNLNEKIREATNRFIETKNVQRFLDNITRDEQIQKACSQIHLLDDADDDVTGDIENQEIIPNDFDENNNFPIIQQPVMNSRKRSAVDTGKNVKKALVTRKGNEKIALFRRARNPNSKK